MRKIMNFYLLFYSMLQEIS